MQGISFRDLLHGIVTTVIILYFKIAERIDVSPSVIVHACNPRNLGGGGKRISSLSQPIGRFSLKNKIHRNPRQSPL
jgi:hypothetical protein